MVKTFLLIILMTVGMIFILQTFYDIFATQVTFLKTFIYKNSFCNVNLDANSKASWWQLNITQLSNLGKILYLHEEYPKNVDASKQYKMLIWKYGPAIEDRYIKRYSNISYDPFEFCSVSNCVISYDDNDLDDADMVIANLFRTTNVLDLPSQKDRKPKQIWAFITEESPYNTFLNKENNKLADYNGIFNWSITYRSDSDVPVPYGRTILRKANNSSEFDLYSWIITKKHDVFVTILGSNCCSQNQRWQYVSELKKHIDVDVYGDCGTLECPGHYNESCVEVSKYIFYLAFENANCDEYITEKVWFNAYSKNSIPVIMGPSKNTLTSFLPNHSYIDVNDYESPRDLANYLTYLVKTPSELQTYFQWKKHYEISNEHGFFKSVSYHYCRMCQALNYNSREPKVYTNLTQFWSINGQCQSAWNGEHNKFK